MIPDRGHIGQGSFLFIFIKHGTCHTKRVSLCQKATQQNAASTTDVGLSSVHVKISGGVLRGGSELTSGSLSGLPQAGFFGHFLVRRQESDPPEALPIIMRVEQERHTGFPAESP